jgi:hypothetical protein
MPAIYNDMQSVHVFINLSYSSPLQRVAANVQPRSNTQSYTAFLADPASLHTLPHDQFITTSEQCPICREHSTRLTVQTTCKHIFHRVCLTTWLRELGVKGKQGTCPCCRHVLFSANEERRKIELQAQLRGMEVINPRGAPQRDSGHEVRYIPWEVNDDRNEMASRRGLSARLGMNESIIDQQEWLAFADARRRMADLTATSPHGNRPSTRLSVALRVIRQSWGNWTPSLSVSGSAHDEAMTNPRPETNAAFAMRARNASGRRHSISPTAPTPHASYPRERS